MTQEMETTTNKTLKKTLEDKGVTYHTSREGATIHFVRVRSGAETKNRD